MSMYHMMMGTNTLAGTWIAMLDLTPAGMERLRDAWLQDDGDHGLRVVVLTRCGGGNRAAHKDLFTRLEKHPEFLGDRDADFDNTYAFHEFKIPASHREGVNNLLDQARSEGVYDRVVDNRTFKQRFDKVMEKLKS